MYIANSEYCHLSHYLVLQRFIWNKTIVSSWFDIKTTIWHIFLQFTVCLAINKNWICDGHLYLILFPRGKKIKKWDNNWTIIVNLLGTSIPLNNELEIFVPVLCYHISYNDRRKGKTYDWSRSRRYISSVWYSLQI